MITVDEHGREIDLGEPFTCTPKTPWSKDIKAKLTLHPQAKVESTVSRDGSIITVIRRCPVCGFIWKEDAQ